MRGSVSGAVDAMAERFNKRCWVRVFNSGSPLVPGDPPAA